MVLCMPFIRIRSLFCISSSQFIRRRRMDCPAFSAALRELRAFLRRSPGRASQVGHFFAPSWRRSPRGSTKPRSRLRRKSSRKPAYSRRIPKGHLPNRPRQVLHFPGRPQRSGFRRPQSLSIPSATRDRNAPISSAQRRDDRDGRHRLRCREAERLIHHEA